MLKWVRAEAPALLKPEVGASVMTVGVDEMWRFLKTICEALGLTGYGVRSFA